MRFDFCLYLKHKRL